MEVRLGVKILLTLAERHSEGENVISFRFQPDPPFDFQAGQSLRYRLEHSEPDNRGVSRYFTIASAPSEPFTMFTTRLSTPPSTFKLALSHLEAGAVLEATGPSGQFVYPQHDVPAIFIAGGIGITPFRSILVDLASRHRDPQITLLYASRTSDIPFKNLLDDIARGQSNLNVVYILSQPTSGWSGPVGRIDEGFMRQQIPDWKKPLFYVSGPLPMVQSILTLLTSNGVHPDAINDESFPGYQ